MPIRNCAFAFGIGLLLGLMVSITLARPAPPVIAAVDNAKLTANIGEVVTVDGRVEKASWGKSGRVLTVEFADRAAFVATAAFKTKPALNDAFGGDVAAALQGHAVRLTGRVARYRGFDPRYEDALTMSLTAPNQIAVLPDPATQPARP